MNEVTLYTFNEWIFLEDVTVNIENLHKDKDHYAVYNSIKNHPKFEQNFQLFTEYLFDRLQKVLASHCEKVKLYPVEFYDIKITNGSVKADCNYNQESLDSIMSMVYLPLHSKYDYDAEDLECAVHTYFWWSELDNKDTYLKMMQLFDFAEQESTSVDFEVISDFKATVYGVEVTEPLIFNTLKSLKECMLKNPKVFNNKINYSELFKDLTNALTKIKSHLHFGQSEITDELCRALRDVKSFDEIGFWLFDSDHGFEFINAKIAYGDYLIKNT